MLGCGFKFGHRRIRFVERGVTLTENDGLKLEKKAQLPASRDGPELSRQRRHHSIVPEQRSVRARHAIKEDSPCTRFL
jgi:hypothetical protein